MYKVYIYIGHLQYEHMYVYIYINYIGWFLACSSK